MALHFDPDCECGGAGSFVTLSQSLCRDLLGDEKPATAEEWAALDFQPWTHADDEWTPPTNEEWNQFRRNHLTTVRLAWISLYKTKAELMEIIKGIGDDGCGQLFNRFTKTTYFLERTAQILHIAEARLIAAGTVLEVEGGADAKQ